MNNFCFKSAPFRHLLIHLMRYSLYRPLKCIWVEYSPTVFVISTWDFTEASIYNKPSNSGITSLFYYFCIQTHCRRLTCYNTSYLLWPTNCCLINTLDFYWLLPRFYGPVIFLCETDTVLGGKCWILEGEKFKILQRMPKIHVSTFLVPL